MSFTQELASARYLQDLSETETTDTMISAPPAARPLAAMMRWVNVCAVLAGIGVGAAFFFVQPSGKGKSNRAADFFLWISGSKLTWKEYQQQQRYRGNQRLDETQYDWQQQLLNDAYSRSR